MVNKIKKQTASEDFVLEEWLNSLTNDGVRVRVLRETDDGRMELIDSKKMSLITDEYLLKLKPGSYKIQVCRQNGTVVATRSMAIGERPDTDDILTPANSGNDFNDRIFLLMQAEAKRSHEMILALIAGMFKEKTGGSESPAALLNAMTGAMANMQKLGDNGKDPLDTVDKVLSIADRIGGNSAPKTTIDRLMDVAGQFLPALLTGGAPARALLRNPQPETVAVETPALAQPAPGPKTEEGHHGAIPSSVELKNDVSKLWARLLAAAEKEYDIDDSASMVLDLEQLGDPSAAVIVESIIRAKTFEDWKTGMMIDPKYQLWFNRFFMAVLKMTEETPTPKQAELVTS